MKKLNVAIIGQGRSGKDIHGHFLRSDANQYFDVKYVVDFDERRRKISEEIYPGCKTFEKFEDLFGIDDIDLVVNSTFSQFHYSVTKSLIEHGFNVLVEKPFAKSRYECEELIALAKQKGVLLAVFQQSFLAPYYIFSKELAESGKLGNIKQVSIRFNGFARRWDWQTLQKNCAGGIYNTGPHPIGLALGFLDFDENAKVVYSKLGTALTSGDSDDYAKIIMDAPGKPVIDIEVTSCDAYSDYNVKLVGDRGTFKTNIKEYQMTYTVDGENPERPVIEHFLEDENGKPLYCSEKLIKHTEEGNFGGTAFDAGTKAMYEDIYFALTEGKPMRITPYMAMRVIEVIEKVHAENPLPLKFL